MLRASPPDDGADADGRFDVDSVLVTEFLLSFVGTLAGRNDSSDIAACSQRARRFRAFRPGAGYYRLCIGYGRAAARNRSASAGAAASSLKQVKILYSAAQNLSANQFAGNPAVGCRLQNNVKAGTASLFVKGGKSPLAQHTKKKASTSCLSKARRSSKNTGALATSPAERC